MNSKSSSNIDHDHVTGSVEYEEWTLSPGAAIQHIRNMSPRDQIQTLLSFKSMAQGSYGGQIEAWSLFTIRGCVYPGWSDHDFQLVVDAFESEPLICSSGKPLGSI